MPTREQLFGSAQRLHAHLLQRHFDHGLLRGPDPGVRFNLRAWRFLKSALPLFPWRDDYVFMQTQGYWVLSNWALFDSTREPRYRQLAVAATEAVLKLQSAAGAWSYPLPERKHLVATVEGNWGAAALIATYAREPRREFLAGAARWYDFLITHIGFQAHSGGKAINYFDRPRGKVPNNSVEAAWLFLRLWEATGDTRFLEHVDALLEFVGTAQLPSGEIPYIVGGPYEEARDHYLCFQYNAFQFLKLAWSSAHGPGARAKGMLPDLARFLERGVAPNGACSEDCSRVGRRGPEVDYYTAALAAALREASSLGVAETSASSDRCYAWLLGRQKPDGSFDHSQGDYGFLNDHRSYPRQQVMTLFHLLYACGIGDGFRKPGGA